MWKSKQKQLINYIQQHLDQLGGYAAYPRTEEAAQRFDQLVEMAQSDVKLVQRLIMKPRRLVPSARYDRERAQRVLIRVLAKLDPDGRMLYRVLRSWRMPQAVKSTGVSELGSRNDPALLLPLLEWLQPQGWRGWIRNQLVQRGWQTLHLAEVDRSILFQLGRQQIAEAIPLIEQRDEWMANHPSQYRPLDRVPLVTVRAQFGEPDALHTLIKWSYGDKKISSTSSDEMDPVVGMRYATESLGGAAAVLEMLGPNRPPTPLDEALVWLMENGDGNAMQRWARAELVKLDSELALDLLCNELGRGEWLEALTPIFRIQIQEDPVNQERNPLPIARVRAIAADPNEPRQRRLWAVYALFVMEHDATDLWEQIPDPYAPLSPGVPESVQRAIASFWAPLGGEEYAREGTDIRLLIEGKRQYMLNNGVNNIINNINCPSESAEAEQLADYRKRIYDAGLTNIVITSTHDDFYVVEGRGYWFLLSKAGPFCCGDGEPGGAFIWPQSQTEAEPPSLAVQELLKEAGFLWMDKRMLETKLENYFVEMGYVSNRGPQTQMLRDLLFFHHDGGNWRM